MGTKKMILSLLILLSLNTLKTYSQNGYTDKIKWECKYCIECRGIVYSDTCEMKDSFEKHGIRNYSNYPDHFFFSMEVKHRRLITYL